jgi:hypothetical protein
VYLVRVEDGGEVENLLGLHGSGLFSSFTGKEKNGSHGFAADLILGRFDNLAS